MSNHRSKIALFSAVISGKGLNRKTTTSVPIGLEALAGLEGLPFLLTDVGHANLASQAQLKEGGTSDKMSLV